MPPTTTLLIYSQYSDTPVPVVHWNVTVDPGRVDPIAGPDLVYAVVDDGHGNFWFSSAQGLFKVSKEELRRFAAGAIKKVTSVAYGEKDGMKTKAGNLGNQPLPHRKPKGCQELSLRNRSCVRRSRSTASFARCLRACHSKAWVPASWAVRIF
jgi:hypothetical protein